ncbi:MAG: TlpA family protein disulfide reductase [Chitinophagaceae bacterium]|nr:MAG: alkyl hydroperoxide reductase [Bacteroidetes bacterium OLB11]MCC6448800.1 TlpA family protein disulfide reductase [Chitinophagaceae bacterium]HMN32552.1 TlpA disulfide reductase family protein [Chitinophagaceae bacterium]
MKKIVFVIASLFLSSLTFAQSQSLPNTSVRDINGKQISFSDAFEKGKVTLVSFWATWCVPCKQEIKNIKTKLPEWQKEVNFNYMTVSIDDARATAMVKTYAKSQGWTFPVLLDPNSDLKRSLNFQNVPYTLIVDKNGKIVYQHTGYEEGSENELFKKVKELAK